MALAINAGPYEKFAIAMALSAPFAGNVYRNAIGATCGVRRREHCIAEVDDDTARIFCGGWHAGCLAMLSCLLSAGFV